MGRFGAANFGSPGRGLALERRQPFSFSLSLIGERKSWLEGGRGRGRKWIGFRLNVVARWGEPHTLQLVELAGG